MDRYFHFLCRTLLFLPCLSLSLPFNPCHPDFCPFSSQLLHFLVFCIFFSSSKHTLTSPSLHRVPNINTNIAFCRCPLARLHTLLNRMRTALDPSRYAIHTLPICGSCHSDASQGFPAAASRHWAGFCTRHLKCTYPSLVFFGIFLRQNIFLPPLPASAFAMSCIRFFSRLPHGRRAASLDQLTLTAPYQTSAARCAASVTRHFCLHLCHICVALDTQTILQKSHVCCKW